MKTIVTITVLLILVFPVFTQAQGFQSVTDMKRFFNRNLRYPSSALDKCVTGYVLMKFEIDSLGKVSKMEKLFGDHYYLVEEASRVVEKSDGKWRPLFKEHTVVLLPFYFMYERHDKDPVCDSARPAGILSDAERHVRTLAEKDVLIRNGIMLSPIVVVGYAPQRKESQQGNIKTD